MRVEEFLDKFEEKVLKAHGYSYRKKQREIIRFAINSLESGKENVLINAPPGIGKTVVNYAVALYFYLNYGYTTLYTTPQIPLLDQIERDPLLNVAVIKGRDNYPCLVEPGKTAANGRCVRDRRFKCVYDCPYRIAKMKALDHPISAMSFAYLVYDRFLGEAGFGNRDLIIVDEADDLESWAEEFGSFVFKTRNEFRDIHDVVVWARAVLGNVKERISELEKEDDLSSKDLEELEKLRKYEIKLTVFLSKVRKNERNWVFEKTNGELVVKPVKVGDILGDLVWSRGNLRICSSATILEKEMFCKTTGLRYKSSVMVDVGSTFPIENRMIFYLPVAKMTKDKREKGYRPIADAIAEIVEMFEGYRGICHAHSYEIAREIYSRIESKVRVGIHDRRNRKSVFNMFLRGEIDFLISVGFSRGIDLKYDLARYQVITKCPFPSLSDVRVRELWVNRKAWNWARYVTIRNLVQTCGRIVRAEDDWGYTFILDRSFEYLWKYAGYFPLYFIEAVKFVDSLDEVRRWLLEKNMSYKQNYMRRK